MTRMLAAAWRCYFDAIIAVIHRQDALRMALTPGHRGGVFRQAESRVAQRGWFPLWDPRAPRVWTGRPVMAELPINKGTNAGVKVRAVARAVYAAPSRTAAKSAP
jgi:hypothetical protein